MVYERRKARGFTLIELMIAIVVLSILITLAIPSFGSFLANGRSTTMANDLIFSLKFARSEAIKRGGRVVVCPRSGEGECSASADDWGNGWLVVEVAPCGADGCQVLQEVEADYASHEIDTGATVFSFNAGGRLTVPAATVSICAEAYETSRRDVAVGLNGRTSVSRGRGCEA